MPCDFVQRMNPFPQKIYYSYFASSLVVVRSVAMPAHKKGHAKEVADAVWFRNIQNIDTMFLTR